MCIKAKTNKNISSIYLLIADWKAGAIETEREFLVTLREMVQELVENLEEEESGIIDYDK